MADTASITFWIDKLKAGDQAAAQPLWNRYFEQLVRLAYQRLRGSPRAAHNEEDVALSAIKSFCAAVERGRFPVLRDRDDLWKLLVVITERKSLNQLRDQARLKRGGAAAAQVTLDERVALLADLPGREPTLLFAAQMVEECQRLFEQLGNDTLRKIACDRMEGYTNEEIASPCVGAAHGRTQARLDPPHLGARIAFERMTSARARAGDVCRAGI
jgi:DNA-directed RNA polymerase specialized sigma24 family protein